MQCLNKYGPMSCFHPPARTWSILEQTEVTQGTLYTVGTGLEQTESIQLFPMTTKPDMKNLKGIF